jgi:hypothetical protein
VRWLQLCGHTGLMGRLGKAGCPNWERPV